MSTHSNANDAGRTDDCGGVLVAVAVDVLRPLTECVRHPNIVLVTPYLPENLREKLFDDIFDDKCLAGFYQRDRDKNETLEPKELFPIIRDLASLRDLPLDLEQCERFANIFDTEGTGVISRNEFVKFARFLIIMSFLQVEEGQRTLELARGDSNKAVWTGTSGRGGSVERRGEVLQARVRDLERQLEGNRERQQGTAQLAAAGGLDAAAEEKVLYRLRTQLDTAQLELRKHHERQEELLRSIGHVAEIEARVPDLRRQLREHHDRFLAHMAAAGNLDKQEGAQRAAGEELTKRSLDSDRQLRTAHEELLKHRKRQEELRRSIEHDPNIEALRCCVPKHALLADVLRCCVPKDPATIVTIQQPSGCDLHEYVSSHGKLNVDQSLALAKDLFSAVDHLHENGIVHGDVAAKNIVLHRDRFLLSGFGRATVFDVAQMRRHDGYKSDLFGVGATLYFAATGLSPCEGAKLGGRVEFAGVPEWFKRFVLESLKDPDRRRLLHMVEEDLRQRSPRQEAQPVREQAQDQEQLSSLGREAPATATTTCTFSTVSDISSQGRAIMAMAENLGEEVESEEALRIGRAMEQSEARSEARRAARRAARR